MTRKEIQGRRLSIYDPRALKFVPFRKIEDHFRQGWVILIPKWATHHDYYGCEMAWICECPVPGGFAGRRVNRVPPTPTETNAHERAASGR